MATRDPLATIIGYNRQLVGAGRDPSALRLKLDRLCASPFGFLRGTFHLFAADWPELGDDPLAEGSAQPIVGDLHLENFGAFRAASGDVVFDVNDFDETAAFTPALDVARLATSIVLADDKHGDARAVERIGRFVDAWAQAAQSRDLHAFAGKEAPAVVRALVAQADDASRADWLARRVEGDGGQRRFRPSDKYQPLADARLGAAIAAAAREFGARCSDRPPDVADWPHVLDVAARSAGTGSLGRFRWAVLIQGKSDKPGKERILELKEALPSSLAPDEGGEAEAARVIATQRRLQAASPAYLGVAHVDGRSFTVRELQPTEAKVEASALKAADLDDLCAAVGTVLGRMHRRASDALPARIAGREASLRRRIAAFALRYAAVVVDDLARLRAGRADVARALGITVA